MKITAMETIVVELPGRSSYTWRSLQAPIGRYVILKVTTDDGLVGLGEAPALLSWGGEHGRYFGEDPHIVCHLVCECFAPMLVGTDPHDLKRRFPRMDAEVRGYPYTKAMIESAMLDVVARNAGLPVHQLLGGAVRDWIPLCHSVGMAKPERAAGEAAQVVADGIRWLQIKVTGGARGRPRHRQGSAPGGGRRRAHLPRHQPGIPQPEAGRQRGARDADRWSSRSWTHRARRSRGEWRASCSRAVPWWPRATTGARI